MSTKIYNGYKLPLLSTEEFFCFVNDLRNEIKTTSKKKILEYFTHFCAESYDLISLYEKAPNEALKEEILKLFSLYDKYSKGRKHDLTLKNVFFFVGDLFHFWGEQAKDSEVPIDLVCSATFHYRKDKILMMFFGPTYYYKDILESNKLIEEYYYFNNSDQPEEISDIEWETRRIDWDDIFVPIDNGVLAELFTKQDYLSFYEIIDENFKTMVPSIEKRANTLLKLNIHNVINLLKKEIEIKDISKKFSEFEGLNEIICEFEEKKKGGGVKNP